MEKNKVIVNFIALMCSGWTIAGQVIHYADYSIIVSSTWNNDRHPDYVINGAGLSDPAGNPGTTHADGPSGSFYSWHTDYNNGSPNGIVEHAWMIFDLGGLYTLDSMNVWNYNHPGEGGTETTRSIHRYNLWVRTDNSAGSNIANSNKPFNSDGWTLIRENAVLQPAPGLKNYTGERVPLEGVKARRVAIEILSNYEGFDVTGDGLPDTDPYGPLVGCSEVRFFKTFGPILVTETQGSTLVAESGKITDEYSIRLLQQPFDNVTIQVRQVGTNQLDFAPETLTFTPADWGNAQYISVRAIDDNTLESDPHYAILQHQVSSPDPNFNNITFPVEIKILENDCGAWGFNPVDFNFDCHVDLRDLSSVLSEWLACSLPNETGCEKPAPQAVGTILPTAYQLPPLKPLVNMPVRDTSIILGPDGMYYLTGTTGHPTWWTWNDGIRLWRSPDLENWTLMDQPGDSDGLIWNVEKEGTWAKQWKNGRRAIWAPEIHSINGTYWITYCVNWGGTGLLKSLTGLPEGPYSDVKSSGPLTGEIDASLFQDDDGKVYFVWQNGKIWQMNEQMDGFVGNWQLLAPSNNHQVGFEGAFLSKINGRYYLGAASLDSGRYDFMVASADSIYGPYGKRAVAVPHAGHNILFQNAEGQLYSTFFGSDDTSPIYERAAFLPVKMDENGNIVQVLQKGLSDSVSCWRYVTAAPSSGWTLLGFDDSKWTSGTGGFGLIAAPGSVARTEWNRSNIWMRRKFELPLSWPHYTNLTLHVFHTGDTKIYLNGQLIAELPGSSSGYEDVSLPADISQRLLVGTNVLAVHCIQSGTSHYIDVGLSDGH
jgi:hypothetical protein